MVMFLIYLIDLLLFQPVDVENILYISAIISL